MTKTLILLRHAHRDKPLGSAADNGLSEKGHSQAKALAKLYKKLGGDEPYLVSSPKKRCLETLEPLAEALELKIAIDPALGEGPEMAKRLKQFYAWWKDSAPELVVACSHGDWIPAFVQQSCGATIACAKGSWCELQWVDGEPYLVQLLQDARSLV